MPDKCNHLTSQTSPYLLQHADNPVDWYPWGEDALELARKTGKPILLSIGYSACHWCHVMAHESFEDPETAELMNEYFVNIKVDREERPDLDKIYQTAHQALNQHNGGWPLTVFLTPDDLTPFFTGTYFPKTPRHGLISFIDLMQRIHEYHEQHREEIRKQNAKLQHYLQSMTQFEKVDSAFTADVLHQASEQLLKQYDMRNGGFGQAPKFPHPTNLQHLLHHWHTSGEQNQDALSAACTTLKKMALGGVYDQAGGGFYRYSVDEYWMIPHFEKMLYDNACLLPLYIDAWKITGRDFFLETASGIANWVMREMQSPEGGYYSSLDADSEGEEGKFYVWTPEEIQSLLTPREYAVVEKRYGLDRAANFEGLWHLHAYMESQQVAKALNITLDDVKKLNTSALEKICQAREQRVHPGRDEKILSSWNALMLGAMANAGRRSDNTAWTESAKQALAFIQKHLWHESKLLATYKDGKAHLNAYLDDHAFLLDATIELLQAEWDTALLEFAIQIADRMLDQFEDKANGGFYFTSNDHEALIQRPKPIMDEATPSGNGVAACALLKLGYLLGDTSYIEAAERTVRYAWSQIQRAPFIHNQLLVALEMILEPPQLIILRGDEAAMQGWSSKIDHEYDPKKLVFSISSQESNLPEALKAKTTTDSPVTAWHCRGMTCQPPETDMEKLLQDL